MSIEEYLALYEKFLLGKCDESEIKALLAFKDDVFMSEDSSENLLINEKIIHFRIKEKLRLSIQNMNTPKDKKGFNYMKIAAIFLVFFILSLLVKLYLIQKREKNSISATNRVGLAFKQNNIHPGENKAFLNLADGSKIALDDAKNGKLLTQKGFQISNVQKGMLTYHFKKDSLNSTAINLHEMTTISTPRGGQFEIILGDGTKVWLNAASSIRFPLVFTGQKREVEISGEAYFEVVKNKLQPFRVQINKTFVEVLGTHFNINAYQDQGGVRSTLLEGSIRMSHGNSRVLLKPGQQAEVAPDDNNILVSKADISQTMGWKNGFFVFHDLSLENIMKQVSRWYNVDIIVSDDVKKLEFGGRIAKINSINKLMQYMELTRSFHYKIIGRRVELMR